MKFCPYDHLVVLAAAEAEDVNSVTGRAPNHAAQYAHSLMIAIFIFPEGMIRLVEFEG